MPSTGTKISVGPPYFAMTFAPIFVALLLLVPFGPRLAWRRGDLKAALRARSVRRWASPLVAGIAVLAHRHAAQRWPAPARSRWPAG